MELLSLHTGHFVHRINPLLGEPFGMKLWYYGLTYSLGFLGVYLWFMRGQTRLGWPAREIYDLSILVALGVLLGGRTFEIVFYEWAYYQQHPLQVLSYWRGGMATHGILLGGFIGAWLFSRLYGKSLLAIADEMAIPAAFIMGVGRIGNFIDGNIVGSVTDAWWAVEFPHAEGFRHPVTLYDSLKNFMMIPLLHLVKRVSPPGRGMLLAHFVFWYGFGRVFVDYFREYPVNVFGIGTGQYFNLLMAVVGLGLMGWFARRGRAKNPVTPQSGNLQGSTRGSAERTSLDTERIGPGLWPRRLVFVALLVFPLIIPTDWTQGNVKQPQSNNTLQSDFVSFVKSDPIPDTSLTPLFSVDFPVTPCEETFSPLRDSGVAGGGRSGRSVSAAWFGGQGGETDRDGFPTCEAVGMAHYSRRLPEPSPAVPAHHPRCPPRRPGTAPRPPAGLSHRAQPCPLF